MKATDNQQPQREASGARLEIPYIMGRWIIVDTGEVAMEHKVRVIRKPQK